MERCEFILHLSFRDCIGESLAFWFILMELFVFVVVLLLLLLVVAAFAGSVVEVAFAHVLIQSFLPCASTCKNHAAL